ncbi:MAG: ABC transporter permease [Candidatus Scalindua sp.]|jgi:lipopolysaccharide transport system permease protein|nr:ABC transporter permease [Candidatus Scalindua sp.]MBT6046034.1 ABC transporter permease [Candidatus Scalindua sp.]
MANQDADKWDFIIKPKSGWSNIDFCEIFRYRDLILMFVKRDFVTFYKQTILGPLWYIIQPLVNSVIFTIIFSRVAEIPTDGMPPFLFYMAGTVTWGYFAACLTQTSNTFVTNREIFGKVYFPRMTIPISIVITGLFQFMIQFVIFIGFLLYFWYRGTQVVPTIMILTLPLILLQMAVLGLGMGMLISSLVTKYRDLTFAMTFAVQIWMYLTPVVYPLTQVPEHYRNLYALNPMVSVVETFRGAFLGVSSIEPSQILISVLVTVGVFFVGVVLFRRIEKTFMDTV